MSNVAVNYADSIFRDLSQEEYLTILRANYVNRLVRQFFQSDPPQNDEDIRLLGADYRRVRLGGGTLEAVIVPKNLSSDILEKDVLNGAPFRSLQGLSEIERNNRVIFIKHAPNFELGLMACLYLILYNDAAKIPRYVDPDLIDLEKYSLLDDVYNIPANLIPIVDASGLCMDDSDDFFLSEEMKMTSFYWEHGDTIIIRNDSVQWGFDSDSISDAVGKVFRTARHIYVITEKGAEKEDISSSLLRAILQFNGTVIDLECDDSAYFGYMRRVFSGLCKSHGITIPRDYPIDELLGLLRKSVSDMPLLYLNRMLEREIILKGSGELNCNLPALLGKSKKKKKLHRRGWEVLSALDGLDSVKIEIRRVVNALKVNKARVRAGLPAEPIVGIAFLGAPGTSKTTCARALSEILADEKLLPDGRFTAVSGANLQAPYIGQTAQKTRGIVENADVILIDEAYSLSVKDSPYAAEAIAELCVLMSEAAEKGDKLFILAGYGGENMAPEQNLMRRFLESNPGLQSRISAIISFPSYSPQDMSSIFLKICASDGFRFSEEETAVMRSEVSAYFSERVGDPLFGNGREARNLLAEALRLHFDSDLLQEKPIDEMTEKDLCTLTVDDVRAAIESLHRSQLARSGKPSSSQKLSFVE